MIIRFVNVCLLKSVAFKVAVMMASIGGSRGTPFTSLPNPEMVETFLISKLFPSVNRSIRGKTSPIPPPSPFAKSRILQFDRANFRQLRSLRTLSKLRSACCIQMFKQREAFTKRQQCLIDNTVTLQSLPGEEKAYSQTSVFVLQEIKLKTSTKLHP